MDEFVSEFVGLRLGGFLSLWVCELLGLSEFISQ